MTHFNFITAWFFAIIVITPARATVVVRKFGENHSGQRCKTANWKIYFSFKQYFLWLWLYLRTKQMCLLQSYLTWVANLYVILYCWYIKPCLLQFEEGLQNNSIIMMTNIWYSMWKQGCIYTFHKIWFSFLLRTYDYPI